MNTMQNPRMQAEALKRMGRGPDTQLIHMTDSEIDALNGLSALVFKEPLRTNPETGLPEAGMFKRLLPTVLAIGAATFMGPAAAGFLGAGGASGLGLSTGLATGLGTGLAAFGGHALGTVASGQKFDLGRSLAAGVGSGLTAGLTAPDAVGAVADAGATAGSQGLTSAEVALDPGSTFGVTGFEEAAASMPFPTVPDVAVDIPAASALDDTFISGIDYVSPSMPAESASSLIAGSGPGGMRTFSEGFDYLTAEPGKRILAPLALAGAMGEFDEPLPEAPAGPEREPFVPKKFRATRERRDLDRDEDGEVTEEDIMEVVQALPEGQSSRFFTPMQYTPLSTGGLVNLEQGGSIKAAIQNLTGGEGSTVLPMIAQAVVKPGEEEEEEATTKGYPLGTPGTPPGMPTTGIAIGGDQPPQPFQAGGDLGDATDADMGNPTATLGEFTGAVGDLISSVNPFSTVGGTVGTALGTGARAVTGIPTFSPLGVAIGLGGKVVGKAIDYFTEPPPPPPAPPPSAPPAGETADPNAAEAAAAAAAMASMGMDLGDQPEDFEPGNPAVPGGLPSLAETAANVVSSAPGIGGPSGGGTDVGDNVGGFGGIGGPTGADDTSDDPGGASSGAGSDPADADADDPIKTGGQVGIGMQRLLKFEQGGLAGIPYFEGRVMPTGDPKEDGMSDNIPFVIAGQEGGQMGMQPAILSPDEYVIPADVVSMLGNGSSTAGSNQLDQFISNFRMDKYGRPKQPPEMRGGLNSLA